MADLHLLSSDQTKISSTNELHSLVTAVSYRDKHNIASLLDSLEQPNASPLEIAETSRDFAQAVSSQMRALKANPATTKAVLNDIPPQARGAVEDALKSFNITPAYLVKDESGTLSVVSPSTEKIAKRPNPVEFNEKSPVMDLRTSENTAPVKAETISASNSEELKNLISNDLVKDRGVERIRENLDKIATMAKSEFEKAGIPENSRNVVIDVPAHLTGAMESAMERHGIAVVHANAKGELSQGATGYFAAEERGIQAIRKAMEDSRGVNDAQIRDAVSPEVLQAVGQNLKELTKERVEKALAAMPPEAIDSPDRGRLAVFNAAKEIAFEQKEAAQLVGPVKELSSSDASVQKPSTEIVESSNVAKAKDQEVIKTRSVEPERGDPLSDAQRGARVIQAYMMRSDVNTMRVQTGTKLKGLSTYIATPDKYEKPLSESYISKSLDKETLVDFAKNGIPHRELDAISNSMERLTTAAGLPSIDKLDAIQLRDIAKDLSKSGDAVIEHEGARIGTVSELRNELAKVNALESHVREQLKDVLPEKNFEQGFKQLTLPTLQDIAKNGVDKGLVEQFKSQMNSKDPSRADWFKTEDALNAIATARNQGGGFITTAQSYEGREGYKGLIRINNYAYEKEGDHKGTPVMLSMQDLNRELAKAVKTLGLEDKWNVGSLETNVAQVYSGKGEAIAKDYLSIPAQKLEAQSSNLQLGSKELKNEQTEKPEKALEEAVKDNLGRKEPYLDKGSESRTGQEGEATQGKQKEESAEKERSTSSQRQASFEREMSR